MKSRQRSVQEAIRGLGHGDIKERENVEGILRRADPPPTWALIQAACPIDEGVRLGALKVLVKLADPDAADCFVEHLEDPVAACRWHAAQGLVALGAVGLDRTLEILREYPKTEWLLRGTHHVLSDLGKKGFAQLVTPVLHAYQSKAPEIELPAAASAARGKRAEKERAGLAP